MREKKNQRERKRERERDERDREREETDERGWAREAALHFAKIQGPRLSSSGESFSFLFSPEAGTTAPTQQLAQLAQAAGVTLRSSQVAQFDICFRTGAVPVVPVELVHQHQFNWHDWHSSSISSTGTTGTAPVRKEMKRNTE